MTKFWFSFLICWAVYVALIAAPLWSILLGGGVLLLATLATTRSEDG